MPLQTRRLSVLPKTNRQPHIPTIAQLVPIPSIAHEYHGVPNFEFKRVLRFPCMRSGRGELGLFGPWAGERRSGVELSVVGSVSGLLGEDVVVGRVVFKHPGRLEICAYGKVSGEQGASRGGVPLNLYIVSDSLVRAGLRRVMRLFPAEPYRAYAWSDFRD
jgi:hypothetical protein